MAGRRGPSRGAETSSSRAGRRTTRASALQSDSDSAADLPFIPSRSSRNRNAGHRKTASFSNSVLQEEDEESDATLRAARRARTQSVRSRRDSQSTTATARGRSGRRLGVRQSLTGPGVQETTIDERVDMVAGIAGDCLVKLLRLDGRGHDRAKKGADEAARAWAVLQSSRELYLFSTDSSLFPLLSDMTSSLHPDILNSIDTHQLVNTLALNNLATFIWVVSHPDVAQELYKARDVAATPAKGKGKTRARTDDEMLGHVRRRNAILLKAWKEFWNVAIPRNKRSSDKALELWLDFSTIVYIFYQTPTIDPPSDGDPSLPEIAERVVDDLFSHSAVDRYGQWDIDEDGESQEESETSGSDEKRVVDARWKQLAQQRRRTLDQSALEVSMRKFPYDAFRRRVLAFVRDEVLGHSPQSALLPPSQYASLAAPYSPSGHRRAYGPQDPEWDDNILPDLKEETSLPQEEESDILPEEETYEEYVDEPLGGEDEIDWDLAADVLDELEQEEADFVRDAERLSLQASPRKRDYRTMSPANKRRPTSELDEWDVRDRHRSVEVPSFFGKGKKAAKPLFSFGKRQEDAEQIEWETQAPVRHSSKPRTSAPLGLSVRPSEDTPRARATSNHLPRHSMSRLDELRSAQDIFRRRSATPTQSRLRSEGILPADSIFRRVAQKFIPVAGIFHTDPEPEPEAEESEGDEEDEDDLLPSTQHIRGLPAPISQHDETDDDHRPSATEIDPEEEQMLPDEEEMQAGIIESMQDALAVDAQMDSMAQSAVASQKAHPRTSGHTYQTQALADIDINQDIAAIDDVPAAVFEEPALPTSQTTFISSRHRTSKPDNFAAANPDEDEEDRQLITHKAPTPEIVKASPYSPPRLLPGTPTPPPHNLSSPTPTSARRPANASRSQQNPTTPRASASRATATPRPSSSHALPTESKIDPYMLDEEGDPLEPNDEYVIPRGHVAPKSRLHGNVDGQTSIYSRVSGKQKWTKEEELLLYRTVQQVPLSEIYPLRVVWHLHGEFGSLSHELEMFNPQHMKDKMRVIVTRRINNQEPVEGRARAYLAGSHPLKQAFEEEERERKAEMIKQRREETDRYIEEEARKREISRTPKKKSKKGKRKGKGKKRQEAEHEDDELESDIEDGEEDQVDEFDPDVEGEPELDPDRRTTRAGPSWRVAPRSDPKKRTRSAGGTGPDSPTARTSKRARIQTPPTQPTTSAANARNARHAAREQRQAETENETEVDKDNQEEEAPGQGSKKSGRVVVEIPKRKKNRRNKTTTPAPAASHSPTTTQTPPRRNTRSSAAPPSPAPAPAHAPTPAAEGSRSRRAARKSAYSGVSTNLATGKKTKLTSGNTATTRSSRSRTREHAKSDSEDTPHEDDNDDADAVEDDIEGQEDAEESTQARTQREKDEAEWLRRELIKQKVTAS